MGQVLVFSDIPLLTKREEKDLFKAGIQVTTLYRYSLYNEYLIRTGRLEYDIIVIDDSLHNIDVFETCALFRRSSKATIIVIGNTPSKEMWDKCKDIGFHHYFQKPIEPRELANQIKKAMDEIKSREASAQEKVPLDAGLVELVAPKGEINVVKAGRTEPAPVIENQVEPLPTRTKFVQPMPIRENRVATLPVNENRIEPTPVKEKTENVVGQPVPVSTPPPADNGANILHDSKVANLISEFLNGKIKQLSPEINLGFGDGFSYREADNAMGTSGKETMLILESLVKQGILIKRDFEKILVSPTGSVQLIPVEKCPTCDSSDLVRGQLVEHFACGHIGLEEEFMRGMNQVCPKCHKELKLIGTDYRKPGMRYICNACHGIFPAPTVKSRDLKTGDVYRLEDLHYIALYTYSFNESYRKKLEFELEPKKQLIEYLNLLGYDVQEAVQVQGRSGAVHKVDIVATMDDIITRHTVAIGILAAPQNDAEVPIDPLFNFDSRIYDTGIDSKMVIAMPRFSPEAMKFAERQGIRVYGLEELRALLSWRSQLAQTVAFNQAEPMPESTAKPDMNIFSKADPKTWLKWLLEKRGYTVEENLKLTGRSGAEHTIGIYAEKDDGIINHKLAACIFTEQDVIENDVNEVMKFDTAAYDVKIRDKVLISVPPLSKEARQFAEYQNIKIVEAKDMAGFSNLQQKDETVHASGLILNKQ